ncbi:MAG TPA: PIN domain-containing protein [Mucilaginibacter sp.]|jgi:predicted nucleic acid-binding protein|nr:PIN domain-containing protein [Mucilaginibacter sp.]
MDIVLVDTSVWINFFKANETTSSLFLKNNLSNIVIATCPVIVQEVLQGIVSDKDFRYINSYLNTLTRLIENSYELAEEAAKLYRELRKKGVTARKPNDCLIATYAIRNNIALLQDDKDFRLIAQHSKLKII